MSRSPSLSLQEPMRWLAPRNSSAPWHPWHFGTSGPLAPGTLTPRGNMTGLGPLAGRAP